MSSKNPGSRTNREMIKISTALVSVEELRGRLNHAFKKHGPGVMSNGMEALGIISLELDEFKQSIQNKEGLKREKSELLDIAAAAMIAVMSINTKVMKK